MSQLDQVLGMLNPDPRVYDSARRRQGAVCRNEETDYLPLLIHAPQRPERKQFPSWNLKECYFDREKMLMEHLWGMISLADAGADGLPSMRCNTGVGTLATIFGCHNSVFEDKMPWITRHQTRKALDAFEPVDIARKGEMPRVLDYMAWFADKLDGKGWVYCADNQGPLDLAHLAMGDDVFTAVYDDPEFLHRLLDKCVTVSIEALKLMKKAVGEPIESGYHSNGMYMDRGGIRICEDSTTLFRPEMVAEFALPYTERLAAAFGGAWVHFCGGSKVLLEQILSLPSVHGINFGNPERYDPAEFLPACLAAGKYYHGTIGRNGDETLEAYFRRILKALGGRRKGLILSPQIRKDDPPHPEILALWRRLQDQGA